MNYLGKYLMVFGVILIAAGIFFTFGGKIPSWLGGLPGDIIIQKKNFTLYFPVTTCILISIILSILFFLFFKR